MTSHVDRPPPGACPQERFASDTRIVSAGDMRSFDQRNRRTAAPQGDIVSKWQTLAVTLELAQQLCTPDGGELDGLGLLEMRWWGQVRAGDSLRVHARAVAIAHTHAGPGQHPPNTRPMLLWTVDQSGRCVFSCLVLVPVAFASTC